MMSNRFNRDYSLIIRLKGKDLIIAPPFRIQFEATKTINRSLNKATIKIYNLAESTYSQLRKDDDSKNYNKVALSVGYDDIGIVFQGNIHEAKIRREGTDIVTTLDCLDGGFDFLNSFTSKTVKTKAEAISTILNDMPNTTKGKLTKQNESLRPKVLVGSSAKLIERSLQNDEDFFIDNEKLYILKSSEVVSNYIAVVDSETGLLTTPSIEEKKVTFDTLFNPLLKVGGLCKLETIFDPSMNGVYKIETIVYTGDNFGDDWSQGVACISYKG